MTSELDDAIDVLEQASVKEPPLPKAHVVETKDVPKDAKSIKVKRGGRPSKKQVIEAEPIPESPSTRDSRKIVASMIVDQGVQPFIEKASSMISGVKPEMTADPEATRQLLRLNAETENNMVEAWVRLEETEIGAKVAAKLRQLAPWFYGGLALIGVAMHGFAMIQLRQQVAQQVAQMQQLQQQATTKATDAKDVPKETAA